MGGQTRAEKYKDSKKDNYVTGYMHTLSNTLSKK